MQQAGRLHDQYNIVIFASVHTQWKLPHTTEPLVNDFVYWLTEFISLHGQQTGGIMVEHSTESQPQLIQFCAYIKVMCK